ncbi:MAG: DUF4143 domain-containing protein [Bifidobacteriaceae bacterium]|jgi:predicted AAA+ superfamily ATPase|nr:DUF4143 domain-containing protein [Bifidobacteriaceae bacterium]
MRYVPRVIDRQLSDLLAQLPGVAIEGAKGVGKTRSAERLAASVFPLADRSVAENVAGGPTIVRDSPAPVLLDEWQRTPSIWDDVRRWIDHDPAPGRFLLTGSAAPRGTSLHSGAGRIVPLRMRPLSLAERLPPSQPIRLEDFLAGRVQSAVGASDVGLADYVDELLASGFPGLRPLGEPGRTKALRGYVDVLATREFPDQGLLVRKPRTLLAWMRAYALATASTSSYTKILNLAASDQGDKPARATTLAYRDVLESLWLVDPVPAWAPLFSGLTTPLVKAPKHFLADPALAIVLLRLTRDSLIAGPQPQPLGPQAGSLLGRLFESLVALSLQTYAQACESELSHLRTANGAHEVDFIVERGPELVAIEVKMAPSVTGRDLRHLNWLGESLPSRRLVKVCLTTGSVAYTRQADGVHIVPAAMLTP